MQFSADDAEAIDQEIDLRGVSVLWTGDEIPKVELIGAANAYEAITLLRLATQKLEADNALPLEDEEEGDEENA